MICKLCSIYIELFFRYAFPLFFSIILTNSGHILSYCSFTNLLKLSDIKREQLLFDELIVMDSNDDRREFLVLTKFIAEGGDGTRALQMIEYPCKFW